MFKRIMVLSGLLVINGVAMAVNLTGQELSALSVLNCRVSNYTLQADRLVFGEESADSRQLFLVKNTSNKPVVIDYPEGHIGASAGITQSLAPYGWASYLYVRDHDTMLALNGKGEADDARPSWQCSINDKVVPCESVTYVCYVEDASLNGNELERAASKAISTDVPSSQWLDSSQASDGSTSREKIIQALDVQ